jgi:hypothetical protein
MKLMICLLCTCMMACVAPDPERDPQVHRLADPLDDEVATAFGGTPVLLDVRATDDPGRIEAAAQAASLTACHGYTTCDGGVLIPDGSYIYVDCGEPYCSNTRCAKSLDLKVMKQPRERYRAYAMPNGSVCLAYEPATHTAIPYSCGCNTW